MVGSNLTSKFAKKDSTLAAKADGWIDHVADEDIGSVFHIVLYLPVSISG